MGARGQVELSCYGFGSAYNEAHSLLDRIGYAHGDGKLARLAYPVLDRAPQTQATRRPLLGGVEGMRLRYLGDGRPLAGIVAAGGPSARIRRRCRARSSWCCACETTARSAAWSSWPSAARAGGGAP